MLSFLELLTVEGERCNCLVSGWTVCCVCKLSYAKFLIELLTVEGERCNCLVSGGTVRQPSRQWTQL